MRSTTVHPGKMHLPIAAVRSCWHLMYRVVPGLTPWHAGKPEVALMTVLQSARKRLNTRASLYNTVESAAIKASSVDRLYITDEYAHMY